MRRQSGSESYSPRGQRHHTGPQREVPASTRVRQREQGVGSEMGKRLWLLDVACGHLDIHPSVKSWMSKLWLLRKEQAQWGRQL